MAYRKISQKAARSWKRRALRAERLLNPRRSLEGPEVGSVVVGLSLPQHHAELDRLLDLGLTLRLDRLPPISDTSKYRIQAVNLNPPTNAR